MPTPPNILELVNRFDDHLEAYKQGRYNETQLRREFIDPFFEALGWDVSNKQGYAEAYKDVIHEDAVKVGGATKAPDYAFRVGGARKFFLESKKPSVNIKDDVHPAYQLRRYAWSAKLPLSILTDFEEFAVYDCRVRPVKNDKASTARVMYLRYNDYAARWDEIAAIFSKQAVLKGSFDKYAASHKAKRGTTEVDAAFLGEIERWRELLARNIALRNPGLSQRQLNFAVQRSIDRIIFLRIAEDRGIETYGRLMALQNGDQVYPRLRQLFKQADDRYNSGLFHFQAEKGRSEESLDTLTPGLKIDDKILKDILKNLYYPDSPYEFSVLPADILGQVYEQFLGQVIRLTPAHRAVVEDKPEVKKAGGVYYTPTYIVDYIVRQTVGKLVEGKKPGPRSAVNRLKILDPACGSGSFLLGAYQYLLDWHLNAYLDNPQKWAKGKNPKLTQSPSGDWKLTTAERKRILLDNIFGVDIDPQAVEVTKLSLLLKALEGETEQSLAAQLSFFKERALPDLAANIKCGNSLIGPDFYDERPTQMSFFDEEELYRINAFDWQAEFPEIMAGGGFDAVIGNPPYGMVTNEDDKKYFEKKYVTTEGRFDTYELFIEKGIELCKPHRLLGFIVPNPLLSNLYAKKLRSYILENCSIQEIANFSMDVFTDPTVHTCIIVLSRVKNTNLIVKVKKQIASIAQLNDAYDYELPQSLLGKNPNSTFDIFIDPDTRRIIEKLTTLSKPLGDICFIRQCIKTGNDKIYVKPFESPPDEPWKPTLRGRSINRYTTLDKKLYLKYGTWLARNWKNKSFYETPKIVIRETGKRITATLDLENRYVLSSLYAIYPKSPDEPLSLGYFLGILNSSLATYFVKIIAFELTKGAFTKIRTNQLARLPIRVINFDHPADKAKHNQVVSLVERMLELQKQLSAAQVPQAKTLLKRQIALTDRQIDELVYALYNLSEEDEIKIVEGAQ